MKKLLITICSFLLILSAMTSADAEDEIAGKVYVEGEFLDSDLLKISIRADDIKEEVLGIAFNLVYEGDKLQFVKYLPGDFLELGGDPFYLVKNHDGKVVFGETLRRNDYFPSGSGEIVQLYFQIQDGDDFGFSFEKGVVSTFQEVRQDLINIFWEPYQISQNDGLIFSTKASVLDAKSKFSFYSFWTLSAIGIIGGLGIFAVYFIKNQQSKRGDSSVNFNSGILD